MKKWKYILIAVMVTAVSAGLAALFTDTRSEWYLSLEKSPLTPPGAVFGIAWGILYILLAVSYSLMLISSEGKKGRLYILNAVLLVPWCLFFFTLKLPVLSLVTLAATFFCGLFLLWNAYEVRPLAGYLLIPYVLWLGFATYLNYYIVLMN